MEIAFLGDFVGPTGGVLAEAGHFGPVLAATLLERTVGQIVTILYVALGLGLVIFFHELGHFAVAKWCGVNVERFSIGFGPVLWSFKKNETEYCLSAVPFGGYVKMLGQDDMDPSQLSSEEIAQDPRAYSSKSVPQRMAIISAGVVMNIVTGMLFFALAFGIGVQVLPAQLGSVQPGSPAWEAGLDFGDRITAVDEREVHDFGDIVRGVALSSGDVTIHGVRRDGSTFKAVMTPRQDGRRVIGAAPHANSLTVLSRAVEGFAHVQPGTPAATAKPGFEPGDRIVRVDDRELTSYAELRDVLAERRAEALDFHVRRSASDGAEGRPAVVRVEPQPFRVLGLWLDISPIVSVQGGSPAEKSDLRPGDKITHVDDRAIGTDMNPLALPDYFFERGRQGEEVILTVSRPVKGSDHEELTVRLRPTDKQGWLHPPSAERVPLSVPAAGIAFHVIPTVLKVEDGSPAARAGIEPGQRIRQMELVHPDKAPLDGNPKQVYPVEFRDKNGKAVENWSFAFWLLQVYPQRNVRLEVTDAVGNERTVELAPQAAEDWFLPGTRGLRLDADLMPLEADNVLAAIQMGMTHTRNWIIDIYLTIRNLVTRDISVTQLHGPVGIATTAYRIAEQGLPELLLFLGMLSVNLAVLNFLPIPVLDGGHMVFLIWEGVTRRKPSETVVAAATYAGLIFILGLMALVIYLDIQRLRA